MTRYNEPPVTREQTETTISRAAQKSVARPRPEGRLHVVHPVEMSRIVDLAGKQATIGRQVEGDLGLRHQTVSRRHLELEWDGEMGRYLARDLGSHNGSALDGVALGESTRALHHGAVLRVGDVILVFEDGRALGAEDSADVSREAVPGEAAATRALRAQIARAAGDPSPALLIGETGTGKERLAAELHRLSGRRGDLVAVNCAAFTANLVESQLLGHVRGAFTGAQGEQPGLIRSASAGTLFLDEIGELPLDLQPKLLRVIQEREVLPVGGAKAVRVDVRMVAASNRDLARHVEAGGFRRDLYARMALWEIRVPPLRERRADVLGWVRLLHGRWLSERGQPATPLRLTAEAAEKLILGEWHDNLRGLDRFVHELSDRETIISAADLPGWIKAGDAARPSAALVEPVPPRSPRVPAPTREELAETLARLGGSVRATAKHYRRDRRQIYRWLEAFGLKDRAKSED